jgi:hypothetical protein
MHFFTAAGNVMLSACSINQSITRVSSKRGQPKRRSTLKPPVVRLLQGFYFGCTNGSILCIDPESSALLGTTAASQPEAAAAAVSSIAVNKEAVVSASSSSPQLAFYSRCSAGATSSSKQQQQQQQARGLQLLGSARASTQGKWYPASTVMPFLPNLTCQQTPTTVCRHDCSGSLGHG